MYGFFFFLWLDFMKLFILENSGIVSIELVIYLFYLCSKGFYKREGESKEGKRCVKWFFFLNLNVVSVTVAREGICLILGFVE